ncbi:hypothetical protein AA0Y32_10520 [Georgenia phoenicis]|uniref:hypothetical protein n=1 Tax=unclassified Georgenia TaxID=2626815 RepID=UPI0039AF0A1C
MTKTTHRRAGLLLAVVVLLSGCDGAPEERPPTLEERVSFEEVAMPEALVSSSRRVSQWSVVPQSGDLPRLAVTTVAHGQAAEADVGVWQATGVTPLSEQSEVAVQGDVASAQVATDGTLTAIAGSTAVDGVPRTYLLTSSDRTTWQAVELGEEAAAIAASHVAVSDGRVYLLGAGATARVPRVAVLDTSTGDTTVTALPAPAEGETLAVSGLAAVEDRVLAVTAVGPSGNFTAPRAHVSEDGSFETVEMGPDTFAINGVVAAGDTFVATGSVRTAGYTKPASWSSADGRAWSVDDIVSLWEWDPDGWANERADVWFTAPTYDPGSNTVAAAMRNAASLRGAVALRDPDGTWDGVMYSTSRGFSPNLKAMQLGDHTALLTTFNGGSAEEIVANLEEVTSRTELVSYATEPDGFVVANLADGLGLMATTTVHVDGPEWWRITTTSAPYTYSDADGLVASAWGPDGLPEESDPIVATDPHSGRTVLVTDHWSDDQFGTATWSRDDAGTWAQGQTISADSGKLPTALAATEDGWLLALETEHAPSGALTRRAEIWASPDGAEWTRQEGELTPPEGRGSVVHGICDSALGPVAVGSVDDAEGRSRATAWREVDGAWAPSSLPDTTGSWFGDCVGQDGAVTIFGGDGVVSRSWRSTDLTTFEDLDALDEGLHRSAVVAVTGGWAAGGTARTETYVGPVLWLSADARDWSWVPLPVSTSSGAAPVVAQSGDDLLVLHPGLLRAWRVPDVAGLLAPPG